MNVWLDDNRMAPSGWKHVKTAWDAIVLLKTCDVVVISLDHDLGDDKMFGTGYHVVLWMEEQTFMNPSFIMPEVLIHSANPVGVQKMMDGLNSIYQRLTNKNKNNI